MYIYLQASSRLYLVLKCRIAVKSKNKQVWCEWITYWYIPWYIDIAMPYIYLVHAGRPGGLVVALECY